MARKKLESDHDLLTCIDVKLGELKVQFENHLSHHFWYTTFAWTTVVTLLVTLIVFVVTGK